MEVIFSFRFEVIFPLIEVACFCVRNDRLFIYSSLDTITRPFLYVGAFARNDLRILRRLRRAFFNDDERMFFRVRLTCRLARRAIR